MGPNSISGPPGTGQSNNFEGAADKAGDDHGEATQMFEPELSPDPNRIEAFLTPSTLQIDPDLRPVAPALILNALALTPVDRSSGLSPAGNRQRSVAWIQNENAFPMDGFVPFDPRFNFSTSKFPKPVWPKTPPTIPTSFFKDHRSKKKVGQLDGLTLFCPNLFSKSKSILFSRIGDCITSS